MASQKNDSFKDLRKGKYDWKVPARIMNLWRGQTTAGVPFKSFNLLLLDHKRCRIHAFVPSNIAETVELCIQVGKMYLFQNFTVKDYKEADKFRAIHKTIQIVFSADTKIKELDESDVSIEKAVFDFYDLADLKQLSKQTIYLTDVIGVIEDSDLVLNQVNNKFGVIQNQIRFYITDGSQKVKVTFWDSFAELFYEALSENFEYPLIIIVGCGRVSDWQEKVSISNVAATTFYLNYNHHSVIHMRKMLKQPQFAEYQKSFQKNLPPKLYTIEEIKTLGEDSIESYVLCKVTVEQVPETKLWYYCVCTSCYNLLNKLAKKKYECIHCPRQVPYPLIWYCLSIVASDPTGQINILLENKAAEKCLEQQAADIFDEDHEDLFPDILKSIESKDYTIKLVIKEDNIKKNSTLYVAKDLMEGHNIEEHLIEKEDNQPKPLQESYAEPSGSSYHLESMSENN